MLPSFVLWPLCLSVHFFFFFFLNVNSGVWICYSKSSLQCVWVLSFSSLWVYCFLFFYCLCRLKPAIKIWFTGAQWGFFFPNLTIFSQHRNMRAGVNCGIKFTNRSNFSAGIKLGLSGESLLRRLKLAFLYSLSFMEVRMTTATLHEFPTINYLLALTKVYHQKVHYTDCKTIPHTNSGSIDISVKLIQTSFFSFFLNLITTDQVQLGSMLLWGVFCVCFIFILFFVFSSCHNFVRHEINGKLSQKVRFFKTRDTGSVPEMNNERNVVLLMALLTK